MMRLDELERALAEVRDFCAARDTCDGCPFGEEGAYRHLCYLSPFLYDSMIPANWEIALENVRRMRSEANRC